MMHLLRNQFHTTGIILLLCLLAGGCEKSKPQQPALLKDLVDKEVWRICDSFNWNEPPTPDTYVAVLHRLQKEYPADRDSVSYAEIVFQLAMTYATAGQQDSTIRYMEEIKPYFEAHPPFIKQLYFCYTTLAMAIKNKRNNLFRANYYATKAAAIGLLPYSDTIFDSERIAQGLHVAAETNMECRQSEQALHFGRASYQMIYPLRDSFPLRYIRAGTILANVFSNVRQHDSAARCINEVAQFVAHLPYENPYFHCSVSDARAIYYSGIKKYDSSLTWLLVSDSLVKVIGELNHDFASAYSKLEMYTQLGNRPKAAAELHRATQLLDKQTEATQISAFYKYKTQYLIRYGDRDAIAQSFQIYDSLTADIYNADRLKMFSSIESEYNLADKQKNIARLDTANKAAQDEIRQKNNLLIISVLAILLLGVGTVVFFLLARQRKLLVANQSIEAQRDKIQLEQRLLRTQMEPHFIFNTLNVMKSLVRSDEKDKAMLYLDQFARLLRTSLEHSRENYVPVTEEIEALQDYVSLQAIRFGNKFDYSFELYEGYEDDEVKIPPMLLQPFVENAIQHGVSAIAYRGMIRIRIEKRTHTLYCTVADNGAGIPKQPAGVMTGRKSLAIKIARERLDIAGKETGQPASVEILDPPARETGTIVALLIPYIS